MKKKKIDFGYACLLALPVFFSVWLYLQFPIYSEQKITRIVERNIPIGTRQADTIKFLDALKSKGVLCEKFDWGMKAYFPNAIDGWSYIAVYFEFKNDMLDKYEMERVNI